MKHDHTLRQLTLQLTAFFLRPYTPARMPGMAEGVGFEPTEPFGSPVFKTGALNHSAIPPRCARFAQAK